MFPTLTAQSFRLDVFVPHEPAPLPDPILPVETLKVDLGKAPVLEMVAGTVFKMLQFDSPLAVI
jgi:hypothetical protein